LKIFAKRTKMLKKILFSFLGVLLAIVLFKILEGDVRGYFKVLIEALILLVNIPILIHSIYRFVVPKELFRIENNLFISKYEEIDLTSIEGYYIGANGRLVILKKDGAKSSIEIEGFVEIKDFSKELEKYIPHIKK
jgi:hypothetical protein